MSPSVTPNKKKPPFPMMSACIRLCKFVGFWKDDDDDDNRRKLPYQSVFIIAGVAIWFLLPSAAFIYRHSADDTLIILLKPILELTALSIFDLRFIWHVACRDTIRQCYQDLQEAFGEFMNNPNEDVRRTLRHLRGSADRFVKIYAFVVLAQASSYGFVKTLTSICRFLVGDESHQLATVVEADYVFFDHMSNFRLWLPATMVSLLMQYALILSAVTEECLYWNLLHHVSCLFKIVRFELVRLGRVKESRVFKEKLSALVEIHEVALRSARHLEGVLNPVVGLLYCSCVYQLCYVMFVISVVDDDDITLIAQMVFVLQYTVFLIFTFSMLATELKEESAAISEAIYTDSRWYQRSTAERRLLLLIQMRSDQPAVITVARFFHLNRVTFNNAITTAYSFFTVMRQMLQF